MEILLQIATESWVDRHFDGLIMAMSVLIGLILSFAGLIIWMRGRIERQGEELASLKQDVANERKENKEAWRDHNAHTQIVLQAQNNTNERLAAGSERMKAMEQRIGRIETKVLNGK